MLSMYQACVPVSTRALNNLRFILVKGQEYAKTKGVSDEVVLTTRLIPDMLPLVKQVQIACDIAARGMARLAGQEPRSFVDNETNFEQVYARIDAVLAYVETFESDQIDGSENRTITIKMGNDTEQVFTGKDYLYQFVLPNLFFHSTTAYNILRVAGAPLGKLDFLGQK